MEEAGGLDPHLPVQPGAPELPALPTSVLGAGEGSEGRQWATASHSPCRPRAFRLGSPEPVVRGAVCMAFDANQQAAAQGGFVSL